MSLSLKERDKLDKIWKVFHAESIAIVKASEKGIIDIFRKKNKEFSEQDYSREWSLW